MLGYGMGCREVLRGACAPAAPGVPEMMTTAVHIPKVHKLRRNRNTVAPRTSLDFGGYCSRTSNQFLDDIDNKPPRVLYIGVLATERDSVSTVLTRVHVITNTKGSVCPPAIRGEVGPSAVSQPREGKQGYA